MLIIILDYKRCMVAYVATSYSHRTYDNIWDQDQTEIKASSGKGVPKSDY